MHTKNVNYSPFYSQKLPNYSRIILYALRFLLLFQHIILHIPTLNILWRIGNTALSECFILPHQLQSRIAIEHFWYSLLVYLVGKLLFEIIEVLCSSTLEWMSNLAYKLLQKLIILKLFILVCWFTIYVISMLKIFSRKIWGL